MSISLKFSSKKIRMYQVLFKVTSIKTKYCRRMQIKTILVLVNFYGPLQNVSVRNTEFRLGHAVIYYNWLSIWGSVDKLSNRLEIQQIIKQSGRKPYYSYNDGKSQWAHGEPTGIKQNTGGRRKKSSNSHQQPRHVAKDNKVESQGILYRWCLRMVNFDTKGLLSRYLFPKQDTL